MNCVQSGGGNKRSKDLSTKRIRKGNHHGHPASGLGSIVAPESCCDAELLSSSRSATVSGGGFTLGARRLILDNFA